MQTTSNQIHSRQDSKQHKVTAIEYQQRSQDVEISTCAT